LGIGTLRKPAIAFAAVLCLYGLKQWGQNSSTLFAQDRTVMNFAVAVLVITGLLLSWRRTLDRRTIPAAWWCGLLVYTYAFASLLWGPNLQDALDQWSLQVPYILMIAIVAPLLVKDVEEVHLVTGWTLWIGGIICLLALAFGTWGLRGLRVIGDFMRSETNPLAIASLGGTVFVIGMLSVMTPVSWFRKVICVVLALVGLAVILRSGSRGQLLAAVIAVVMGMPMAAKKRNFGAWLTMLILIAVFAKAGFWIWDQLDVDSARWSAKSSTADLEGRLGMAATLLAAAARNPLTMLFGLGNSSAFHYVGFYPHVALLEVLGEEGVAGFLLYTAILLLTIRNAFSLDKKMRSMEDMDASRAVATLTALFVFELILTFKQGSLLSSVYVVAYAAIMDCLHKQSGKQVSVEQPSTHAITSMPVLHVPNLMR
ncbi:MAG: hypothetical protein ABUL58_07715, partial [Steroidobacter sp.]